MNSEQITTEKKLFRILQIAIAMCFIGHGAFGIITKQVWCNYFAVFGIGESTAYSLMPVIGTFDILLGIIMLAYPMKIIPAWLVFWGLFTALLRPLSGEPFAEFVERAGNYGVPFALLILYGFGKNSEGSRGLFKKMSSDISADSETMARFHNCLKAVVFLLLAGHGWLNIIHKPGLIAQYSALGFSNPNGTATLVGFFEILASLTILIKPLRPVVLFLFIWKAFSELFYPSYGFFEWVERGGSYGAILSLWLTSYSVSIRSSEAEPEKA